MLTGGGLNVTAATIPANGLYLSAANTVALASNTTLRMSVNSTGNITIAAPSSGTAVTLTAAAAGIAVSETDGTVTATQTFAGAAYSIGTTSAHSTIIRTGGTARLTITSAGAATFSGTLASGAFTSTGAIAGTTLAGSSTATATAFIPTGATVPANGMYLSAANTLAWATNSTSRLTLNSTGNFVVPAPTSGVALTVNAVSGTHSVKIDDSGGASWNAGFLEVPINTQNVAYPIVLADSGKCILHTDGTARTYTIPANASIAFPTGTVLTIVNNASAAVNVTIAITTDTLRSAIDGTTGSRTLAQYGVATAIKVTSTVWVISGTGLT